MSTAAHVEPGIGQLPPPVSPETLPESPKPRGRIDSIDLLRGIVMVIMMLDHTRDFIHYGALRFDPLDLTQTHPLLFFTRWITHFCAPTFVFLAGTGSYLQFARGKSKSELSRFLVTRGLWLIVLELTVVRLGAFFSFDLRFLALLQVIWVIGVSMIILAALIHLPLKAIAAIGIAMIFTHNLLDRIPVGGWRGPGSPVPSVGGKLWMVLHQPGLFPIAGFPSPVVFVLYPLIPWIGVMAAGYAFGALYQKDGPGRRRLLLMIGGIATALFVVIRAINIYGDPQSRSRQKDLLFTVLSFLNTQKYPPSLLFLLMTLGPAILALGCFEALAPSWVGSRTSAPSLLGRLRNAFITFGRVPLFFYLLQWPTTHGMSVLLHLLFAKPVRFLFQTPIDWNAPPEGIGFNLAVVYVAWIAGVLLLYPLCKWFAGVRQQRSDWWLSYL